ncbi:chromosome transmission fidelity factor [Pseudohyphozyma bogoriensis]|nr:chromosome transmission fidelity factor [Pseudohyphozyma bogoriensis]
MTDSITLSDSDSDVGMAKPKPKSAVTKPSSAKKVNDKKVVTIADSDDDEMDVDEKPKPGASASKGKSVKRKSLAIESSEDEDVKPKPGSAKKKGKGGYEDDGFVVSDEEDGKGKGKAKEKKVVKKPKVEDGDEEEKKPKTNNVPKWKQAKTGPVAPGSKAIPEGKENCLVGLTFVFTGELSSLSRESGQDLVKRYGGRVTTAPSSKTSYVVLGSEAGPKKLEMIKKHKIKTLDEDGFLELIGKRPSGANDPKYIEQKKAEEKKIKEEAKALGPTVDNHQQLWTVKYAPSKLTEICGNKGNVEKLSKWLEAWPKSLKSDFKKPGPDAMGGFRCVLISGPPGIGKTTAAHLVAKLQGYNILELNASDVRSKKLLESAFKDTVTNTTIGGFFGGKQEDELSVNKKCVIIMDEVDGMSAGDRGGVGALNALIKKSKVPIIAIANDKSTPKMKPLAATCFQMIFKRPNANEIRGRLMTIAFKEKIKVEARVMDQLVQGSQSDIRQIVNMLSTWKLSAQSMDYDEGKQLAKMSEKNSIQSPWNLYNQLYGPQAFSPVSGMTLNDKLDIFFSDISMMPLFAQDNYLKAKFSKAANEFGVQHKLKNLELMSKAADSISEGDMMDRMIHGAQEWSLLPAYGMLSTVRPASFCYGSGGGFPTFPSWFGKNSTQGKLQRLLGDMQIRMRLRISGDRKEIRQSYIPTLFQKIVTPLTERGADAIEEVIQVMDDYYLTKEEWDTIVELGIGDGFEQEGVLKKIPTAVKTSFTRQYNKAEHPVPFHREMAVTKKGKGGGGGGAAVDYEDVIVDDMEEEEEDPNYSSDDSIGGDKLIKAVKDKGGKAKPKGTAKPRKSSAK